MKKIIFGTLFCLTILGLTGCGKKQTELHIYSIIHDEETEALTKLFTEKTGIFVKNAGIFVK